jgi:hypothetical protein
MDRDDLMIFQMMLTMGCNSIEFFTSHEMEEGMGQFMDLANGIYDIGYDVSHTKIIEKSNKFYILGV